MSIIFINTLSAHTLRSHLPLFEAQQLHGGLFACDCPMEDIARACESVLNRQRLRQGEENIHLIVLADVQKTNVEGLAQETLLEITLLERLIAPLFSACGKIDEITVVFAERFVRGGMYREDDRLTITQTAGFLWNALDMPPEKSFRDALGKLPKGSGREARREALSNVLAKTDAYAGNIWARVFSIWCEAMADRLEQGDRVDLAWMQERLSAIAKQTISDTRNRFAKQYGSAELTMTGGYPRQNDERFFALLVSLCAAAGKNKHVKFPLAKLDWQKITDRLSSRRALLCQAKDGLRTETEPFFQFARDGGLVFELKTQIPSPEGLKPLPRRMFYRAFKALIAGQLDDIRAFQARQSEQIKQFVVRITEEFNLKKAEQFPRLRYRGDPARMNLQLLEENIRALQREADQKIAAVKPCLPDAPEPWQDEIARGEREVEALFRQRRAGKAVCLSLVIVFLLAVFAPYALLQPYLMDSVAGRSSLLFGVGLLALLMLLSNALFLRKNRRDIIAIIWGLEAKCAREKERMEQIVREYAELLREHIPMSMCVNAYLDEFLRFKKAQDANAKLASWHKNKLGQYIGYIDTLGTYPRLSEIDAECAASALPSATLDAQLGFAENADLYVILDWQNANAPFEGVAP